MTVEQVEYISDLDVNNPAGGDSISEGDDHIRNIKKAISKTFPKVTGEVTVTHDQLNGLPALLDANSGIFASCRHDGANLLYENNIASVLPLGSNAGYKVSFTQPVTGFDQYYAVLCQSYATSGKHVMVTVTGQTSSYVDIAMLEFDFATQQWQLPENPVGFSLVMVDMAQV